MKKNFYFFVLSFKEVAVALRRRLLTLIFSGVIEKPRENNQQSILIISPHNQPSWLNQRRKENEQLNEGFFYIERDAEIFLLKKRKFLSEKEKAKKIFEGKKLLE